jgi:hypothetical protein
MLVAAFAGAARQRCSPTGSEPLRSQPGLAPIDARDNAPGRLGVLLARALGADAALEDLGRHCSDLVVLDRVFEYLEARAAGAPCWCSTTCTSCRDRLATLSHLLLGSPS